MANLALAEQRRETRIASGDLVQTARQYAEASRSKQTKRAYDATEKRARSRPTDAAALAAHQLLRAVALASVVRLWWMQRQETMKA